MTRRCSHCGHNGHNSRTCPDRGIRLFGVRLTETNNNNNSSSISGSSGSSGSSGIFAIRKSVSMGNLSSIYTSTSTSSSSSPQMQQQQQQHQNHGHQISTPEHSESGDGYVSDGLVQTSSNARERKKGVPWTEEEHRLFLLGLHKLGKGDWRGISRNYVTSRTPTQVASHAQKYFIRQNNLSKRKRRSSLFDISTQAHNMELDEAFCKLSDQLTLGPGGGGSGVQLGFMDLSVSAAAAAAAAVNLRPPLAPSISSQPSSASPVPSSVVVKQSSPGPLFQVMEPPSELTKLSLGPNCCSSASSESSPSKASNAAPPPTPPPSLLPMLIEPSSSAHLSLKLEQPIPRSSFHANPPSAPTSTTGSLNNPISVV